MSIPGIPTAEETARDLQQGRTDEPIQAEEKKEEKEELSPAVAEAIGRIGGEVGALRTIVTELTDALRRPAPAAEPGSPATPKTPTKEEFEGMSTQELVSYVVGEVSRSNQAVRVEMTQAITALALGMQIERVAEDASGKGEDFFAYSDDVTRIMKDGRAKNIRDAYSLAKSESPEKAKPKDKEEPAPKPPAPSPTGQAPRGGGSGGGKQPPPAATTSEAANRAFVKTFGRKPRE